MKKILLWLLSSMLAAAAWSQPTVSATSPTSQTVCSGSSATFTVTATGTGTLTYRWQMSTTGSTWTSLTDGTAGSGAIYTGSGTSTLIISTIPASLTGDSYRCVVTNSQGSTSSAAGTLTVNASPPGQPTNFGFPSCSSDLSNTTNAVDPSLNYQWQTSLDNGATWNNITDGAVYSGSSTYNIVWNISMALNGNLIRFVVSDPISGCSTTSTGVDTIIVIGSPSILTPSPTSANICPGASTNFTIADSTGVSYHWQISTNNGASWTNTTDGSTYSGSTTNSLGITGAVAAARYHVIRTVTGDDGTTCATFSNYAPLSIKTITSITAQPANATVCAGTTATFHVTASGTGPFTYQWQTDDGTSPSVWTNTGTSSATLSNSTVTTSMNGYHYQVLVQGACGSQLTSTAVALNVNGSGTWLGTANSYWENPGNWCGGVPVQTTNVLIPASAPNMPTISTTTGTAYSTALSVQSGAILTISGGATAMLGPFSIPGTVAYTAAGNQPILPADHGSLIIGGSGNKTLSANTGIGNTLALGGSAMLVTGSDLLTMYAGSNPITGASYGSAASSWIVTGNGSGGAGNTGLGGLKIANVGSSGTAFFPIGPTTTAYAPAQITNTGSVNDFTVAVNDQLIPGGPVNATVDRTWLVAGANAGTGAITLGLQWNQADEGTAFSRTGAAVIRSNGSVIVQEGANGSAAGSNPYSLPGGGFTAFTQFSVASSTMVVLPVQLLSFTGQWLNDNTVGLSWISDPQSQFHGFIVQRSEDGLNFDDIGKVTPAHDDGGYDFVDPHPFTGINAYRLQIVATDGTTTYSQIVQLNGAAIGDQAGLAPSVTENGTTRFLLSLTHSAEIRYTLTNISGNILVSNDVRLAGGQHTLTLDLSRYPAGLYFVYVTGSDGFVKTLTLVRK